MQVCRRARKLGPAPLPQTAEGPSPFRVERLDEERLVDCEHGPPRPCAHERPQFRLHSYRRLEVRDEDVCTLREQVPLLPCAASQHRGAVDVAPEPCQILGPLADHALRGDDDRRVRLVALHKQVKRKDERHRLASALLVENTEAGAMRQSHGGDVDDLMPVKDSETVTVRDHPLGEAGTLAPEPKECLEHAGVNRRHASPVLDEAPGLWRPADFDLGDQIV